MSLMTNFSLSISETNRRGGEKLDGWMDRKNGRPIAGWKVSFFWKISEVLIVGVLRLSRVRVSHFVLDKIAQILFRELYLAIIKNESESIWADHWCLNTENGGRGNTQNLRSRIRGSNGMGKNRDFDDRWWRRFLYFRTEDEQTMGRLSKRYKLGEQWTGAVVDDLGQWWATEASGDSEKKGKSKNMGFWAGVGSVSKSGICGLIRSGLIHGVDPNQIGKLYDFRKKIM